MYPNIKMKTVPQSLLRLLSQSPLPFTKIIYRQYPEPDGRIWVRVLLPTEDIDTERFRVGLGIDGSLLVQENFGNPESDEFQDNHVAKFAQVFAPQLAILDYEEQIRIIYWATGKRGDQFEEVGVLTADEATRKEFYNGPKVWGRGKQLLPALLYFVERAYPQQPGFYIFISDGRIQDETRVIQYCEDLAWRIVKGERPRVRLFLVGIGKQVDKDQLRRLDTMWQEENFPDINLWDSEIIDYIDEPFDLLREWVDEQNNIPYSTEGGKILDPEGNVVFAVEENLPTMIEFLLPPNADYFIFETAEGQTFKQFLFDETSNS